MKLLSVAIPSYNSENYLRNCIESLLPGGEDVEIIVVNDGSKDGTAAIADEYANKYPTIVKAVHQENGGHGEAVNAGLRNATGLYYKVVDSDDWVHPRYLQYLLEAAEKENCRISACGFYRSAGETIPEDAQGCGHQRMDRIGDDFLHPGNQFLFGRHADTSLEFRLFSRAAVSISPMMMQITAPTVMGSTEARVSGSKDRGTAQKKMEIRISAMGT